MQLPPRYSWSAGRRVLKNALLGFVESVHIPQSTSLESPAKRNDRYCRSSRKREGAPVSSASRFDPIEPTDGQMVSASLTEEKVNCWAT